MWNKKKRTMPCRIFAMIFAALVLVAFSVLDDLLFLVITFFLDLQALRQKTNSNANKNLFIYKLFFNGIIN